MASPHSPAGRATPLHPEKAAAAEGDELVVAPAGRCRDVARRPRRSLRWLVVLGCLAVCGFVVLVASSVYRLGWLRKGNLLERISLADVDAQAVCNDGRPAAYYRKLRNNARKWFILLEGGAWCWDKESCARRSARHISDASVGPHHLARDGVLAPGSPVGDDFNLVWLPYCSSDAHMGDIGAKHNAVGWPFRGARIVRAALRHVAEVGGLSPGDLVVFGGTSAGARGAMVLLDELVPSGTLPAGVRLLGYLDSPYYMEMPMFPGLEGATHNVKLQTQEVVKLMRNEGIIGVGSSCRLKEAWQCAFGEDRMPQLKTPFLLVASMYDSYQLKLGLNRDCCPYPHPKDEYLRWADEFANRSRAGMLRMPQVLSGHSGVFGKTCYDHAVSQSRTFETETTLGVSMQAALRQAIASLTEAGGTPMPNVIDTCRHLNCGPGCTKRLSPP